MPVGFDGSGLVPADVISVAPSGIPVGPMGEPDTLLSGDVAPMVGVGATMPPICATATLHPRSGARVAAISKTLTAILRLRTGLSPDIVRKIHDDRGWRAAHDNPPERAHFRSIDLHMR